MPCVCAVCVWWEWKVERTEFYIFQAKRCTSQNGLVLDHAYPSALNDVLHSSHFEEWHFLKFSSHCCWQEEEHVNDSMEKVRKLRFVG